MNIGTQMNIDIHLCPIRFAANESKSSTEPEPPDAWVELRNGLVLEN